MEQDLQNELLRLSRNGSFSDAFLSAVNSNSDSLSEATRLAAYVQQQLVQITDQCQRAFRRLLSQFRQRTLWQKCFAGVPKLPLSADPRHTIPPKISHPCTAVPLIQTFHLHLYVTFDAAAKIFRITPRCRGQELPLSPKHLQTPSMYVVRLCCC